MSPSNPCVLYSANTWLAYNIARRYYADVHFAWCSPMFNARMCPAAQATNPPTSCPADIYFTYADEAGRRDRHGEKIAANRLGLLKGARAKFEAGVISSGVRTEIVDIVNAAETADFRPLMYIIPFAGVTGLIAEVPVARRAHPLSQEYLIEALPGHLFHAVELERSR